MYGLTLDKLDIDELDQRVTILKGLFLLLGPFWHSLIPI